MWAGAEAALIGQKIASRYVLERLAGSGGMGSVYRARDEESGQPVAVKLLHSLAGSPGELARFQREAVLLSQLRHPGIVSYIAHGLAFEREPYLVMEWLDGEELGHRLGRAAITATESLRLIQPIVSALAFLHGQGLIHRDLKPANIFLRQGVLEQPVLLDFGLARALDGKGLTQTGALLGTPDYMAPELVRGETDLSSAVDVFALGSILHECLVGQPPFAAEHLAATLSKILAEPAPSLSAQLPGVPAPLGDLLLHMLAKAAAERPTMAEVGQRLAEVAAAGLGAWGERARGGQRRGRRTMLQSELTLVSIILAREPIDTAAWLTQETTWSATAAEDGRLVAARLSREVGEIFSSQRARLELLPDGSLIAALPHGATAATDRVAQALRCASALKARLPRLRVALSTGRADLGGALPVGEALDQATALLDRPPQPNEPAVLIDELSDGLLDARGGDTPSSPSSPRPEGTRELLGIRTPIVGREVELATLSAALSASFSEDEPGARVALVIAPPGCGKSRLRQELVRRALARKDAVAVLSTVGDPSASGCAYALLATVLRRQCGLDVSAPVSQQQQALVAYMARTHPQAQSELHVEFLAELCAIPFLPAPAAAGPAAASSDPLSPAGNVVEDAAYPRLRSARQSPSLMADQIAAAFTTWIRLECQRQPVLLVVEDLHAADVASVRLLEGLVPALRDQPLFLLALARPELEGQFPELFSTGRLRISLLPLQPRALLKLVHAVLGADIAPAISARLVEQSAGNPLFLEELIRAQASGRGEGAPPTLLAMLQQRLGRLDGAQRFVLRLASVFGGNFDARGLQALAADSLPAHEIPLYLQQLAEADFLTAGPSRGGEPEYSFRHALMRDAAYGLLTATDRATAHRLAAAYLATTGRTHPRVIAEHFRVAEARAEALPYYLTAAAQAYQQDDTPEAERCALHAVDCGAAGAELGMLRAIQTLAHVHRLELPPAERLGEAALGLLPAGSLWWCRAAGLLCLFYGQTQRLGPALALVQTLLQAEPTPEAQTAYCESLSKILSALSQFALRSLAERVQARLAQLSDRLPMDALALGWVHLAQSDYLRNLAPSPFVQRQHLLTASHHAQAAGAATTWIVVQDELALVYSELGDRETALSTGRASLQRARELRLAYAINHASLHLATVLLSPRPQPSPEDAVDRRTAISLAEAVLATPGTTPGFRGWARGLLAQAQLVHDPQAAYELAQSACELSSHAPLRRLLFSALAIEALLAQSQSPGSVPAGAVSAADGLQQALTRIGGAAYATIPVERALALVHAARGDQAAARACLERAAAELRRRIAQIPEPAFKESLRLRSPDALLLQATAIALSQAPVSLEVA